ncbi:hypothetical protein E3N88_13442 [Mikania micrantha]|uniref:CCHC-type domain-containing protein n=1 Tax=Mikania micrantha TaxID=192012 RepID=A0A5N6P8T2_9ASTR|nr:hypothetical protein E3N88_13442 [Mikania micrantha]
MDTRSSAELKKALETLEAEKKTMAAQMASMQAQIRELSISQRKFSDAHNHDEEETNAHISGTSYKGGSGSCRIANVIELYPYTTLEELTLLAHKVDSQQRLKGKGEAVRTIPKATVPSKPFTASKPASLSETSTTPGKAPRRCFRCQGLGHIASECPNKRVVTLADFEEFSNSTVDEVLADSATLEVATLKEIVGPDEGDCLVVRRALIFAWQLTYRRMGIMKLLNTDDICRVSSYKTTTTQAFERAIAAASSQKIITAIGDNWKDETEALLSWITTNTSDNAQLQTLVTNAVNAAISGILPNLMNQTAQTVIQQMQQHANGGNGPNQGGAGGGAVPNQGGAGVGAAPAGIHVWLERFQKQKPKSFRTAATPFEAQNWIAHIEKLFEVLGVDNAFKVRLATYKLEDDALGWWKTLKLARGGDQFASNSQSSSVFAWQLTYRRMGIMKLLNTDDICRVSSYKTTTTQAFERAIAAASSQKIITAIGDNWKDETEALLSWITVL